MGEINISILLGVFLVAILTEATVNSLKRLLPFETKIPIAVILALATSITLCVLAEVDLMEAFGYPLTQPYVGNVISGIIASLGANALYDLIENYKDYQGRLAVEAFTREEQDNGTE